MTRTCALVVMAAMMCSNCAARGPALRLDRSRAAGRTGNAAAARQDADIWQRYAARLPIGSTVKIGTTDGERVTAVLMIVDDTGITVKPRTRIPEPARQVPFDRLVKLELAGEGASVARAAAVGGGVGAGVFLGLLMLLFAGLD